jgi:predicted RNA-binding protein with PIN domain
MPFLVDGDNLLGTWPGRRRSDAERRDVAMELGRLAHRWRRHILVVFDGQPPPATSFGSNVSFAGSARTADDVILESLRQQADRRGWVVITSDRSLGDQCRYLGARVERCDLFRRRMTRDPATEKPDHVEDLDYWMEQFGEDAPLED